jgi:hypothetical protein
VVLASVLGAVNASSAASQDWGAVERLEPLKALMVVDCLLPGQMRRSGRISYIGPALPVKTTAAVCEMRGGEYVAYDRASLQSTLSVWQEKADGGDAEAQLFIAQAYEKGIDRPADYAQAAQWYAKAAKSGSREAKLSLAALMESGQGMPANPDAALRLYREAMGLSEDLIRAGEVEAQVSEVRRQLEQAQAEAAERIARLQSEIDALRRARSQDAQRRNERAADEQQTRERLYAMEAELAQVQTGQKQALERLQALPPAATRNIQRVGGAENRQPQIVVDGTSFGRYHALVIGVQDYERIEPLSTPLGDARAVADVLAQRYGFQVQLLLNPDYTTLAGEIVKVLANRGPDDNVLIYYAGHGVLEGREGFWLPKDAGADRASSLPNALLVSSAGQFAGRSLLIVADSCFGAALAGPKEISGPLEYLANDSRTFVTSKARYVLSAGGETPVLDDGGAGHSVFTGALLKVLRNNSRILTQRGLAEAVKPAVLQASQRLGSEQTPQVAPMRDGVGNEGGKFYFVPAGEAGNAVVVVDIEQSAGPSY